VPASFHESQEQRLLMLGAPQSLFRAGSLDGCPSALGDFVNESLFLIGPPMGGSPVRIEQCREPARLDEGHRKGGVYTYGEPGGNSLPFHARIGTHIINTHDVPGA
jgi:hypothetical protein